MKKFLAIAFVLFIAAVPMTSAEIKKQVDNFTLEDYNGTRHSLTDYKNSEAVVLMFIATKCPVSNAYNGRMEALNKDYSSKGIVFLGINSNKQESSEEVKEHALEHGFTFTILKDKNNIIANKLDASVTPEIFVLGKKRDVLYHGRIDDSKKVENVSSMDLRKALDAVLAGKPVAVTETKAIGCTIKKID
jgi:peroxiredoxin